MPRVWEILKKFKEACKFRGWRISENEDWVETDNQYHNFLWTKDIHPSSFRKIVSNGKCIVREGLSYKVVSASYTAWLFSETPFESVVRAVFENPGFAERIALYDMSPLLQGKNLCIKLNSTDSCVFQEFERFLKSELKVKLKSLSPSVKTETTSKNLALEEPA
ncbi:hypothetical protein HXY33_03415 [Candidatus Bathyarchaeota archaeon]|nr:hypothetical protein [Candidatus Bathyarchaeota archaeon]